MNQRKKEKVKFLGDWRWVRWRSALGEVEIGAGFVKGFRRNRVEGKFFEETGLKGMKGKNK